MAEQWMYHGGPFPQSRQQHTQEVDEWNMGDEDTFIKEINQYKYCEWEGENEANAADGKRVIDEVDSEDDSETVAHQQPRKQQKNTEGAPWVVKPGTQNQQQSPQRPIQQTRQPRQPQQQQPTQQLTQQQPAQPQSKQPFSLAPDPPAIKKPRTPKGAPPVPRPRGMGDQEPWNAAEFIRNTNIRLSLAQYLHISPKARAALAEVIRSEPTARKTPARKKQTRFAEEEDTMEVNMVDHLEHILLAQQEPNHDRSLCQECAKFPDSAKWNEGMYKLSTQLFNNSRNASSQHPLRPAIKGNFYTQALFQPRKKELMSYTVWKIRIDPGATLNLISETAAKQMGCVIHFDESIQIRIANGDEFLKLHSSTLSQAKPHISLSLVVRLRSVYAIEYDGMDEYWITDATGIHRQLDYSGPTSTHAPDILLAEEATLDLLPLDKDIVNDLQYYENKRCQAIIDEIIREARAEEWDEYEEEAKYWENWGNEENHDDNHDDEQGKRHRL
ncbi:MAG: hypothetical protein Q9182_007606 [Xanthomendoza sp. 2 TL-2023]